MTFRPAALALLALLASPALAQEAPDAARIIADRIDRDGQGTGLVTAVVEDGTPAFAGHGVTEAGSSTPVDETTLFEIGSLSKIFTSLLLAQMVLDGTMELDSAVADYLPEGTDVPDFEGTPVTLFDLATHSAGLPPIPPELAFADPANPYPAYTQDMLLDTVGKLPLAGEPGTHYSYSNTGYALLGVAIAHAANRSYEELVTERILEPLGMEDTLLVVSGDKIARFASGHDAAGEPVPHWDFDVFAAAGGWRSSAADMARFIAAASGQAETPLAPAFALMLERTRPAGSPGMSIGLGWMIREREGGSTVWHNGLTGGFNSFAGFDRQSGRAAVVLANQLTATGIEDIGFHLIDPAVPLVPQPPQREAVEINPALLDNYVGTYELGPEFLIVVTAENGRLFVQASGQDRLEAFAESDRRFFLKAVDAQISFETGADGVATGLVLHQNGQDVPGTRRP